MHPIQRVANLEPFKAIVVGNLGVGKTRMTNLFVNSEIVPTTKKKTIGLEVLSKTIMFSMKDIITMQTQIKAIRVSFYDTAGQEKYDSITKVHYRKALGAIVCYSVTDRKSFEAVPKWISEIKDLADTNCSIVIVANKADVSFNKRQVTTEEGNNLAKKHCLEFYEVSVFQNIGIKEAMNALCRLMTIKYETTESGVKDAFDVEMLNTFRDTVTDRGFTPSSDEGFFKLSNCCVARGRPSRDMSTNNSNCC